MCHHCNKVGHFRSVCRSGASGPEIKPPRNKQNAAHSVGDVFLGEIKEPDGKCWTAEVMIDGKSKVEFKLDSGAEVSVLSDKLPWLRHAALKPATNTLRGPGGVKLRLIGTLDATLSCGDRSYSETLYVIENQGMSLLSRNACVQLNLIKLVVDAIDVQKDFPKLFEGLGKVNMQHHINLTEDARPVCLYAARKVPHPLLPRVEDELKRMEDQGVISKVTQPTDWCSGMVVVPKPNGKVRICVDLTQLNKAVRREVHPMKSVDENLAKLGNASVFSKLDANSGFWQLPLDEESKLLTTFITPQGRFAFNRIPFGISSAPEIFTRTISQILEGVDCVICHMDDILVYASNEATHDERLREVLGRLQEAGLTLNEKCEFNKTSIRFLGHIIDNSGVHADGQKLEAIQRFPDPTNTTELRRFTGMANQLGKFVPNLAQLSAPMCYLPKADVHWQWGDAQAESFERVKQALTSPTTLARYEPRRYTIVAADASGYGIGAILMQVQDNGERKPVCFASRTLTDVEKRYAVIEKEALAATWACDKFADYIVGMPFLLESDHKPLVPLLSSTDLAKMPPRIQRFRMRMMRYNPEVQYVQGRLHVSADALSRAPVGRPSTEDNQLVHEVDAFADMSRNAIPASAVKLQ